MDTSRMSAGQIQMYYNKQRHQQQKEEQKNNQDQVRQRQQTQNGTGHRALHDLVKSDFFKTTKQTLNNNRKKEHIQRHLNDTIDNLSNDKLDDFANKF